jgi:ABC-type nitrate/sulfonate/bicarbonate transport system substrate-binding protein
MSPAWFPSRSGRLLVLSAALVLAACSSTGASPSSNVDTTAVKVAWQSTPDEAYLPLLMAIDAMKTAGYNISSEQLGDTSIVFQGLASNTVQFTGDSLQPGAQGASEGVPVKAITTRNRSHVVWATLPEYEDCSGLDGEPLGVYSPEAAYTLLMELYLEANCPGIETTYVTIQDSPLRAQALAHGQIKGTTLGLPDAMALEAQNPGKFLLVILSGEPGLEGVSDEYVYANEATITDHPAIVQALVSEHLKAIRSLYANPAQVTELVTKHLPDAPSDEVAKRFVADKIWYANGGLTGPGLENTLEAFGLPGDRASIVNQTFLDKAIQELGKVDTTQY